MPKKRSSRVRGPLGNVQQYSNCSSVDVSNKIQGTTRTDTKGIENIKSLLDDENTPQTYASADLATSLSTNTAALHGELDLFRQRWRRELETKKVDAPDTIISESESNRDRLNRGDVSKLQASELDDACEEVKEKSQQEALKESYVAMNNPSDDPKEIYRLAKKLFLIGVDLEQDELHNESIKYYKQAMHLCPNIERQIFREQLEIAAAASKAATENQSNGLKVEGRQTVSEEATGERKLPLIDRIRSGVVEFCFCKPANKIKTNVMHISRLPRDLILKIFRYVIGQELDLASLEHLGMVCRGFYLLSNDPSLWRSISYRTWGPETFMSQEDDKNPNRLVDWRQLYLDKPRVNCDGVYISRTRYIRQGDVGFQDITYRPFHLIRYYRYIRFFSDKRVLILTTNEEPEKIVPIFRHALDCKHFSPELSVLEGSYQFTEPNQVIIVAEKDFSQIENQLAQQSSRQAESRRQARFNWSSQTPLSQKFEMKFELKTNENRPYKNNVLKWCDYTISAKFDTGTEITKFDLTQDSFPNLSFSRVKRFNLRSSEPLTSQ